MHSTNTYKMYTNKHINMQIRTEKASLLQLAEVGSASERRETIDRREKRYRNKDACLLRFAMLPSTAPSIQDGH